MTKQSRGFTLIELMVVISILGFLALVSAGTMFDTGGWLAHNRLRSASRELYANMQKARIKAVKETRRWAIAFNPANDTYRLQFLDTASDPAVWTDSTDPAVDLASNGAGFGAGDATGGVGGASIDDGVSFLNDRVEFTSQGTASVQGYCYITNSKNDVMAVGTQNSGIVVIRKWNRATGNWE